MKKEILFLFSVISLLAIIPIILADSYTCDDKECIYNGQFDVGGDKAGIIISPIITSPGCEEKWTCSFTACSNGEQTLVCTDQNSCGTFNNIPADNGKVQNCTVPPSGGGPNGGGGGGNGVSFVGTTQREACIESWQCGDWSPCINGKKTRACTDSAKCGTNILEPEERRDCSEQPIEINGETSAFNRITGAVVGALRGLRDYEVVGIILFILAIVGSALIINSIRRPPEEMMDEGKKTETKAEVKEKPKNSKKTEKSEK
ncbi:hypothetical protein HYV49_05815 [Candidatus Pacearchaeota archaeon]|nr:hypothetical protein [Candidatus Pacearchaeota archaeon]